MRTGRLTTISRLAHSRQFSIAGNALVGTVAYHNSYILLHTRNPASAFPSKVPSTLQRELQRAAAHFGGLVNFSWSPEQSTLEPKSNRAEWDEQDDRYYATAFSRYRGRMEISLVSRSNLDAVAKQLEEHASPRDDGASYTIGVEDEATYLYVCTHGARDCRCGETGGAVFEALRTEVEKRQLNEVVKVASVGHVGGHKYAANLLVYPYGEWLGYLKPETAPEIIDAILRLRDTPYHVHTSAPLLPQLWRGRMGLDKAEQLGLLSSRPENLSIDLKPHLSRP